MTPDSPKEEAPDELTARVPIDPPLITKGRVSLLPGIIAIAFYMLVQAAVVSFGVAGGHIPPLFLIVAALFVAASFGMLRLFRWAWALTLGAAFSLMSWYAWIFFTTHQPIGAVMGLLNLVFFFYLVRPDVRSRLR
jgi:hypothetical protein